MSNTSNSLATVRPAAVPAPASATSVPAVRGDFAAVRYLKQAEDKARARAEFFRDAAIVVAPVVGLIAFVLQFCGFILTGSALSCIGCMASVALLVVAAFADRRADSLRAAGIVGLSSIRF